MPRHSVRTALASVLIAGATLTSAQAEDLTRTALKPYNVTIRVFDPAKGMGSGQDYVLPVDSPDAEHAIASTMANAASFTKKVNKGKPLSLAFTCTRIEPR